MNEFVKFPSNFRPSEKVMKHDIDCWVYSYCTGIGEHSAYEEKQQIL